MLENVIVVYNPPTARGACALMSRVLRKFRPQDSKRQLPESECVEAVRLIAAQLAVLTDYEKREVPREKHHSVLTATRWLELSADHFLDGILDFEGCPIAIDKEDGFDPLPVPFEMKSAIKSWNDEFKERAISHGDEDDIEVWGRRHDDRGRILATELRKALRSPVHSWTVRFSGMFEDTTVQNFVEEDRISAAAPGEDVLKHVHQVSDLDVDIKPISTSFAVHMRSEAPPLIGVYGLETLHLAQNAFRNNLHHWERITKKERLTGQDNFHGGFPSEMLGHQLRAQIQVIMSWADTAFHSLPEIIRHSVPRNALQASRYVRVMADYSSTGLWTWEGYPADPKELPISSSTRRHLAHWLDLYEREKGWDLPEQRPFTLNVRLFERQGMAIADSIRCELPGWEVKFTGDGTS